MSSSSLDKPDFKRGETIAGWKVIREIGSGGFGQVYEVVRDGRRAAMKAAYVYDDDNGHIPNEVKQLRLLQSSALFCRLLLACQADYHGHVVNCLVMQLGGSNLAALRRSTPHHRFTTKTAFRLGKQCLQALQDMHTLGLLHRDVKSSNYSWSVEQRHVLLLDLGFARRYLMLTKDGEARHRPARKKVPFRGTCRYASITAQNREEQSRRDDLWSWLYMLVEMITGKLPWTDRGDHMQCVIKTRIGSRLFIKCPTQVLGIYDHIQSLRYASRPDYARLQSYLDAYLSEKGAAEADPYDWELGGRFYDVAEKKKRTDREKAIQEKQKKDEKEVLDETAELTGSFEAVSSDFDSLV